MVIKSDWVVNDDTYGEQEPETCKAWRPPISVNFLYYRQYFQMQWVSD